MIFKRLNFSIELVNADEIKSIENITENTDKRYFN